MLSFKIWKSIFLIVGTAIGAGVLALPISTAHAGFIGSTIGLIVCWGFMTLAAYYLLEVRLQFKTDIDLSTMTLKTLGGTSQQLLKVFYLMLLFALVSVYIIVGASWITDLMEANLSYKMDAPLLQLIFTIIMASLIYAGIGTVATVSHFITSVMLIAMVFIIGLSLPDVQSEQLLTYEPMHILPAFPMLITSFGFAIVMPSLAPYLNYHRRALTTSLFVGSLIIIIAYFLWEITAFGVIGGGADGLGKYVDSHDKGTEVIHHLSQIVQHSSFQQVGLAFMFTAILSSFIGVGQCLYHYLKDILPMKSLKNKSVCAIITGFSAPYILIQLYPAGITKILGLAGIFVAIILGILPTVMVLRIKKGKCSWLYNLVAWSTITFFSAVIILEFIT
jgi:tyrosine-specific transport protein